MILPFLLLLLHFIFCHSADIFTSNQTFRDGDLLVSEGNKFAFGFFRPGSSRNRYLGIWFHDVSEQSVVWVVNRNDPISGLSAVLSINQYGYLVLCNSSDQQVDLWSTNVTDKVADSCMVQLLDSGNLVLLEVASRSILWQSFDHLSDTVMSGMRFGRCRKSGQEWFITAWRTANDPGTGEYKFKLTLEAPHNMFCTRD